MERQTLSKACLAELPTGPILVPLDSPAIVHSALHVAHVIGRDFHRGVVIVHAAERPLWPRAVLTSLGVSSEEMAGVAIEQLVGAPAPGVLELVRKVPCGLVLLGLPSHKPGREGLGGVREAIMLGVPCPVLLVPATLPESWGLQGPVLLPLDGTPSTAAVVPLAFAMARGLHAQVEILHVADVPSREPGALGVPQFIDQPQYEWAMWRREFIDRNCECAIAGSEPRLFVRLGASGPAILALAEERNPDMIVLGWHGRLDLAYATTLRSVLEGSRWPVLLQRVPAALLSEKG